MGLESAISTPKVTFLAARSAPEVRLELEFFFFRDRVHIVERGILFHRFGARELRSQGADALERFDVLMRGKRPFELGVLADLWADEVNFH